MAGQRVIFCAARYRMPRDAYRADQLLGADGLVIVTRNCMAGMKDPNRFVTVHTGQQHMQSTYRHRTQQGSQQGPSPTAIAAAREYH